MNESLIEMFECWQLNHLSDSVSSVTASSLCSVSLSSVKLSLMSLSLSWHLSTLTSASTLCFHQTFTAMLLPWERTWCILTDHVPSTVQRTLNISTKQGSLANMTVWGLRTECHPRWVRMCVYHWHTAFAIGSKLLMQYLVPSLTEASKFHIMIKQLSACTASNNNKCPLCPFSTNTDKLHTGSYINSHN